MNENREEKDIAETNNRTIEFNDCCYFHKCVYFNKRGENGIMITEMRDDKRKCKCQVTYMNNFTKYLELICLIGGLIVGLLTILYTLYTLFNQSETASSTSSTSFNDL